MRQKKVKERRRLQRRFLEVMDETLDTAPYAIDIESSEYQRWFNHAFDLLMMDPTIDPELLLPELIDETAKRIYAKYPDNRSRQEAWRKGRAWFSAHPGSDRTLPE